MELVNTRMPGRVEVAQAQLSWVGGNELTCVKVYDSPRGGQILMHLNKVSTSASLWQLLAGSGDVNLVISKPWINTVYDARLSDFKLIHFLEKAGLLAVPEPPPARPSSPQLLQLLKPQNQPRAPSSADTPAAGSSPSPEERAQPPVSPGQSGPQAQPQPQQQQQQQQQQQEPGRLVQALGRINSKMDINADVRMGRVNLVVSDGMLLVAEEIRQILGPKIHITGAVGDRELREWAEEVGEDVSWARRPRTSGPGDNAAAASPSSSHPSPSASRGDPAAAAMAAVAAWPPSPPTAVLQRSETYQPGILQVHSEHLTGEMRVWRADGHTLLHQPATARLDLTPALSRFGLATANPLLGNVVEVRGGERLHATFYPAGGRLPYQEATVEMAPATMSLGPGSMAVQLLDELGLKLLSDALARPARSGTTPAHAPAPALYASLSPMRVTFSRSGLLHTDRVDMWLRRPGGEGAALEAATAGEEDVDGRDRGQQGGGVRLAVWGGADLQADRLDFTLGVAPGAAAGGGGAGDGGAAGGVPAAGAAEGVSVGTQVRRPYGTRPAGAAGRAAEGGTMGGAAAADWRRSPRVGRWARGGAERRQAPRGGGQRGGSGAEGGDGPHAATATAAAVAAGGDGLGLYAAPAPAPAAAAAATVRAT